MAYKPVRLLPTPSGTVAVWRVDRVLHHRLPGRREKAEQVRVVDAEDTVYKLPLKKFQSLEPATREFNDGKLYPTYTTGRSRFFMEVGEWMIEY